MSQTISKDRKILIFSLITAATTVIAGIMHLQMVPGSISRNTGEGILFLVGGLMQIFWAVPVVKHWGKIWQIIGLVGTGVFVILWYLDRLHLMPEGNIFGGGQETQPDHAPREFQQGNMTEGEFPRGPRPPQLGLQVGKILFPPIELFQIAFIGLYACLGKMISKRQ
ncbi:MAG: hypothetical protein KGH95_04130 [Thaumarchaeota archaeon]|nr:hypothetical protein [Nitrososphaerota archaeon]